MQSASLNSCLMVGLLATVSGCYSTYGYQYPYGYQPQYPSAPVYTVPQGQPYAPGGTIPPNTGSPTPLSPPSTYGNGSGGGGTTTDPNYDPNNPPGGTSGGNRPVPNPGDDVNGPAASNPGGLTPTSSQQVQPEEADPFGQQSSRRSVPVQPANTNADADNDLFELPRSSGSPPAMLQNVNYEPVVESVDPYGRDMRHANPEWLRGVVDYDAKTRTWQITYSNNPDRSDPNGGCLTLGQHTNLAKCHSGDIVLVEGAINANQTDARGKPVYSLDKITILEAQ